MDSIFLSTTRQFFRTRTVESTYPYLNSGTYKGKVKAPLFPSIYAAYKLDKLAFSVGFMPIGGGGGATYEDGLPSFEMSQSDLVPALAANMGATAYKMDVYFKGSSTFLGFQGAVSYKINDWISLAAGARYVTAKNTYEGYLRDVQVNTGCRMDWMLLLLWLVLPVRQLLQQPVQQHLSLLDARPHIHLHRLKLQQSLHMLRGTALEGALAGFGSPTTVTYSTG